MIRKLLLILAILALWETLGFFKILNDELPQFSKVLLFLLDTKNISVLYNYSLNTFKIFSFGLILSTTLGYALGMLMGNYKWLNETLYDFLNAIKSIPVTVLLPLFISIFHLEYFLLPIITTPVVAILAVNISDACQRVSSNRVGTVKIIQISKFSYLKHIMFWETHEVLFSTLRVSITYILALQIALDFFLQFNHGLGNYIYSQYYSYNPERYIAAYAAIIIVSISGILLVFLNDKLANSVLKWKKRI